jgi:site-specific DNA-methyltransferase (adenine-specific)
MTEESFRHGTLHLGDARKLIRELESGSVNLILTDPPFGLGMDEFDDPDVFFEIEDELYRVAKQDAWLVFFWTTKKLPDAFRLRRFVYSWQFISQFIKVPGKSAFGDLKYQSVLVFRKGNPKLATRSSDMLLGEELPGIQKPRNPQFKATFANAKLLDMFSKAGDAVLDPFAGFGSVPLVCEMFSRRWVGFEIDPKKFDEAVKLIRSVCP